MRTEFAASVAKAQHGYKYIYWFLLLGGSILLAAGLVNATLGKDPSKGLATGLTSLTLLIPALWFRRLAQRDR